LELREALCCFITGILLHYLPQVNDFKEHSLADKESCFLEIYHYGKSYQARLLFYAAEIYK
jgi:hypothetical protein